MTMPSGRSEVSGDLVSPRSPERVLGDGKQLDVRESQLTDVIGEMTCRLLPGERTVAFLDHAAPRAEVHLVHGHRPAEWILRPPALHPLLVAPEVTVELVDHRGRRRRHFGAERVRIGFQQARPAIARADLVLVARTRSDVRNEQLPDARRADAAHLVEPPVPGVEVPDDG